MDYTSPWDPLSLLGAQKQIAALTAALAAASLPTPLKKLTAAGLIFPLDVVWVSGSSPFSVALQPGTSGQVYNIANTNPAGGAGITVTVPVGASLNGTLNGSIVIQPGQSLTFDTDGVNFQIV